MVIRCLSFGSLWWLRPGKRIEDPLRFSAHAAVFNTTGFVSGAREWRLWLVAGVIRINLGMHPASHDANNFEAGCFECAGLEQRGEWNRLLLGRRVKQNTRAEKVLLCVRSGVLGRIDFNDEWHDRTVQVISGSALHGYQETLILASLGAQFQTEKGGWEVTWNCIQQKKR